MIKIGQLAIFMLTACIMISAGSAANTSSSGVTSTSTSSCFAPQDVPKGKPVQPWMNRSQEASLGSIQNDQEAQRDTIGLDVTLISIRKPEVKEDLHHGKMLAKDAPVAKKKSYALASGEAKVDLFAQNAAVAKTREVVSAPVPAPPRASSRVPFWFVVVCSVLLPPLGVALAFGITDKFWICLLLTLLFWLPGMIYALIQIL